VRVVWRSSPTAPFGIVRALRRGEVLGVPMDLRSRVPSVDAPFLGRRAPTAVGPARIALRSGAAVVVGTVAPRQPEPAEASSETSPLEVTATRIRIDDLAADAGAVTALTTRINDELSRRIRALPHAWVWMHERWPS
jgi:KDO2-lipid IV(A) lauroyltransferase